MPAILSGTSPFFLPILLSTFHRLPSSHRWFSSLASHQRESDDGTPIDTDEKLKRVPKELLAVHERQNYGCVWKENIIIEGRLAAGKEYYERFLGMKMTLIIFLDIV